MQETALEARIKDLWTYHLLDIPSNRWAASIESHIVLSGDTKELHNTLRKRAARWIVNVSSQHGIAGVSQSYRSFLKYVDISGDSKGTGTRIDRVLRFRAVENDWYLIENGGCLETPVEIKSTYLTYPQIDEDHVGRIFFGQYQRLIFARGKSDIVAVAENEWEDLSRLWFVVYHQNCTGFTLVHVAQHKEHLIPGWQPNGKAEAQRRVGGTALLNKPTNKAKKPRCNERRRRCRLQRGLGGTLVLLDTY